MNITKALNPRDDVASLYVSRKEGGRGFASIEDRIDASIQRLEDYIEKNTMTNIMTINRKQKWEEKQNYRRFKRQENISHEKPRTWLKKWNFKRQKESLLLAVQNNAIRTKSNQSKNR